MATNPARVTQSTLPDGFGYSSLQQNDIHANIIVFSNMIGQNVSEGVVILIHQHTRMLRINRYLYIIFVKKNSLQKHFWKESPVLELKL